MIKAGIVTKTEGQKIWFSTSPDGAQCADCSCERPVRIIAAILEAGENCAPGDQVIVRSQPLATFASAILAIGCLVAGASLTYSLGAHNSETLRAALAIAGAALGLGLATLIALPFRHYGLPKARKVSIFLIRPFAS